MTLDVPVSKGSRLEYGRDAHYPRIFLLLLCHHDFDIRARCSRWVSNGRIPGLEFDMVYFADDTILFSTDNRARNELLHLTEVISSNMVYV